jgi:hypothetical protein
MERPRKKYWNFNVDPQIGLPATGRSRGKKHGRWEGEYTGALFAESLKSYAIR